MGRVFKRGTAASLLVGAVIGILPGAGAMATQYDGRAIDRLSGYGYVSPIDDLTWEPIPYEAEKIIVNPGKYIGAKPPVVILAAETKQLQEEKKNGMFELVAQLIRAEAGNQPYEGKKAVAAVVYNRMASRNFPDTVEGVIFQKNAFTVINTGAFDKAGWMVSEEDYKAAIEEWENRSDVEILYFKAGGYHEFGTPVYRIGEHYFSK